VAPFLFHLEITPPLSPRVRPSHSVPSLDASIGDDYQFEFSSPLCGEAATWEAGMFLHPLDLMRKRSKHKRPKPPGPDPEQTRTPYWQCHVACTIANPDLSKPNSTSRDSSPERDLKGGLINLRGKELVNEESGAALEPHCCFDSEPILSILGSSLEKG
jgi:hypothetical protein